MKVKVGLLVGLGRMWSRSKAGPPHSRGVYVLIARRGAPRVYTLGPERWWTIPGQDEVRGNPDGGPSRFWRANRSFELGIGAKDQSNHLLAGFTGSFPQDSWRTLSVFHPVKRMISGLGVEMTSTDSQTLNGWEPRLAWLKSRSWNVVCQVGHFWLAELALWDEPNAELRRLNRRSWYTMKGVGC